MTGFNGAATFRPRKAGEPPLPRPAPHSFNGAATFRPRKVLTLRESLSTSFCFNGAATFRPRKGGDAAPEFDFVQVLQWGRDLSAAEGARCIACIAGLGVLQWGRDLSAAEGR